MALAVRRWGDNDGDRPLAVLVHGITSSSLTWWRLGPALAERGWRVVAPDLFGHGDSPAPPKRVALDDLADAVVDTIRTETGEASGDGASVDLLLGHSLGALTAMTLVARDPSLAPRVVLEEPPASEAADVRQLAADARVDAERARREPEVVRAEVAAGPPPLSAEDADARLRSLQALDADALADSLRHGLDWDVAAMARKVEVPALLILGREALGSMLTGDARAATATQLPRGWTEVLECGHNVHRLAFDSYLRRLDAWLDRVGAKTPAG
jgi:pimeloyl-ACP methyl ester carboxylesterase